MTNEKLVSLYSLAEKNGGPFPVSVPLLYHLAKEGKIPVIKLGKRILVPWAWVEEMLSLRWV